MFSKQLFHACMAISSATTFGAIEFFNQCKFGSTMLCNHHLSNPFTVINDKITVSRADATQWVGRYWLLGPFQHLVWWHIVEEHVCFY